MSSGRLMNLCSADSSGAFGTLNNGNSFGNFSMTVLTLSPSGPRPVSFLFSAPHARKALWIPLQSSKPIYKLAIGV